MKVQNRRKEHVAATQVVVEPTPSGGETAVARPGPGGVQAAACSAAREAGQSYADVARVLKLAYRIDVAENTIARAFRRRAA